MTLPRRVFTFLLVAASAAAQTAAPADPTLPPVGAKVLLTLQATGVQIYACKDAPTGAAWTFVAPRATLLDHGAEAGTHDAGPTWTLKDGSSVKGAVLVTQPSTVPGAIPWLLLKAAETHGSGALSTVAFIRRSDTSGGKPRTTGCDAANLNAKDEVPYKATYTFYSAAP